MLPTKKQTTVDLRTISYEEADDEEILSYSSLQDEELGSELKIQVDVQEQEEDDDDDEEQDLLLLEECEEDADNDQHHSNADNVDIEADIREEYDVMDVYIEVGTFSSECFLLYFIVKKCFEKYKKYLD